MSLLEKMETKLQLIETNEGLTLTDGTLFMRGDLTTMLPRLKNGRLQGEFLIKAAKYKKNDNYTPLAIDATAGMGEDSLLLAAYGYQVILYEKNPIIFALLRDSLERAAKNDDLKEYVSRMKVIEGDSIKALSSMNNSPDLVLLDPMFPQRQKSGLIKKKFQLLQKLECPCDDEFELFSAALSANPQKIVVKRPSKSVFLAERKPSYQIAGPSIRYDVYV